MRKKYLRVKDKQTGTVGLAHRRVAATLLGRSLLPGEVVHHVDGNSMNNSPNNLLVLSSQRFHAHIEHVFRQESRGQPYLFPELLRSVRQRARAASSNTSPWSAQPCVGYENPATTAIYGRVEARQPEQAAIRVPNVPYVCAQAVQLQVSDKMGVEIDKG